ncbi:MAG: hypothetical protein WB992_10005, partial [Bryobacteraceae bacterium]
SGQPICYNDEPTIVTVYAAPDLVAPAQFDAENSGPTFYANAYCYGCNGQSGGGGGGGRGTATQPQAPPKTGAISQGNCVAGFTAAGAGIGAVGGAWVGGGIGGAGGAAGGTLVAPGVGTIGGGVLGADAGAAGGALVGGGLGAGAGYVVGSVVCASRSGGGGGSNFGDNQRQNRQANDAKQAAERITGKRFTPAQARKFHDAISGQGLGYHDLVGIAVEVLEGRI